MFVLPKLFALIQSKGPDTSGTDKEKQFASPHQLRKCQITILGCMWFLSCTSGIMGAQVYTHAHALQQPDQCSSVIGGASCSKNLVVDCRFRTCGKTVEEPAAAACTRTRMRSKNRIVAHRSIDGPASPEYFKDDELVTGSNGSGPCLLRLRSAWRSYVQIPLLLWAFMRPLGWTFFWPAAAVVASPCLYQRRLASDSSSCLAETLGEIRGTRWLLFQLPEKHTWKSLLLFWHEK